MKCPPGHLLLNGTLSAGFLKQQCGGPGGIRTHYRSIMSRQLIPIKLPALLQEDALPRVTKPKEHVERRFPRASNLASNSFSIALAKVCEFALKRPIKQARRTIRPAALGSQQPNINSLPGTTLACQIGRA